MVMLWVTPWTKTPLPYLTTCTILRFRKDKTVGENGWPRVELYIERGFEHNKRAFELLRTQQDEIEKEMGQPLSWEKLPKARRVAVYTEGSIEDPPERLGQLQDWAVEVLGRFVKVFCPRVAALPKDLEQIGDVFAGEAAKKAWEARKEG
jgi:hypothetical protein